MTATAITSAGQLGQLIADWTVQNSGFEDRRYLGMSGIATCARQLARELIEGRETPTPERALLFHAGYLWEHDLVRRLQDLGLYSPGRELIADFDDRFRGHTDGEIGGDLLEIKSVTAEKIAKIQADGRIPYGHNAQIQTYMLHGAYSHAFVVYVARDSGTLWVEDVRYQPHTARKFNDKARMILEHVDAGTLPACECPSHWANRHE